MCWSFLEDLLMIGGSPSSYLWLTSLNSEKKTICWVCGVLINSCGIVTSKCVFCAQCYLLLLMWVKLGLQSLREYQLNLLGVMCFIMFLKIFEHFLPHQEYQNKFQMDQKTKYLKTLNCQNFWNGSEYICVECGWFWKHRADGINHQGFDGKI